MDARKLLIKQSLLCNVRKFQRIWTSQRSSSSFRVNDLRKKCTKYVTGNFTELILVLFGHVW